MKLASRIAWSVAGGLVLALVAMSYLNPHIMLDLADKLWSCF
jgi:small neutral amino acid transporter SnatA (MarC family)